MNLKSKRIFPISVIILISVALLLAGHATSALEHEIVASKPALTVTTGKPNVSQLAFKLNANGNIAAWQEAIVGSEVNGLRLDEVRVNVGDVVKKGQILAVFAAETLAAELLQIKASVAEAEANAAEAMANAERARGAKTAGAMSAQLINQYLTAEQTTKARLKAQRALANIQQLKMAQTQVLSPDDGVISARNATVGAVLPAGQEMFRLIRQGRLEWRAEVTAAELMRLKPGVAASINAVNGDAVKGTVRMIAPTVDPQTRLGIVYVDLPPNTDLKVGMFVTGEFELGSSDVLTVPQHAVVVRDGFNYVFRLGTDNHVEQVKINVGRRSGDRLEVLEGLDLDAVLVTSGVGFLNDGDLVKVVAEQPDNKDSAGQRQ